MEGVLLKFGLCLMVVINEGGILPTVPAFASTSGSDNASRMSFNSDLSENDIREFPLSAPWKEDE